MLPMKCPGWSSVTLRPRITDNEGFVLNDILVVGPRKTLRLVRLVFIGTNEIPHVRSLEQTIDVVVVPHELDRRVSAFLLSTEFIAALACALRLARAAGLNGKADSISAG